MKELKENSEKARSVRFMRGLIIACLIAALGLYVLVAFGFIGPAIPLSFVSEYHKELEGYKAYLSVIQKNRKTNSQAWNNLHHSRISSLNLFISSTSGGTQDLSLTKITKVNEKYIYNKFYFKG